MRHTEKDLVRFWAKVDRSGECWLWNSQLRCGYGLFRLNGKIVSAHRFAYSLENTLVPNLQVCHSCDTPACVRPSHLFQGTAKINSDDKFNKGRGPGVLSNEQVMEIRARKYTETILSEVIEEFRVTETIARNALTGQTYQFLPGGRKLPRQKSARKLSDEQVASIVREVNSKPKKTQEHLAQKYGVSRFIIYQITHGKYT